MHLFHGCCKSLFNTQSGFCVQSQFAHQSHINTLREHKWLLQERRVSLSLLDNKQQTKTAFYLCKEAIGRIMNPLFFQFDRFYQCSFDTQLFFFRWRWNQEEAGVQIMCQQCKINSLSLSFHAVLRGPLSSHLVLLELSGFSERPFFFGTVASACSWGNVGPLQIKMCGSCLLYMK